MSIVVGAGVMPKSESGTGFAGLPGEPFRRAVSGLPGREGPDIWRSHLVDIDVAAELKEQSYRLPVVGKGIGAEAFCSFALLKSDTSLRKLEA